MSTLAPERTAAETVDAWRRGLDDSWENPAGPRFLGDYTESEITLTGGQTNDPATMGSLCTGGICTACC
ncbi:hypothetical protein JQS43_17460 [Natronosporangium hydrolyticum]|uniref:Uncharacterized protein n=1 Tax=Natronosporangium hydrolyticum TaxID=2811111 RepID=A0A895Y6M1_9ACTN|nr:DUF6229 family protein [Natronosporangium hydrolyticum]QSB13397.1 hypothetical protein JQS43_17460 [Natronosporangium hydrolyticum]